MVGESISNESITNHSQHCFHTYHCKERISVLFKNELVRVTNLFVEDRHKRRNLKFKSFFCGQVNLYHIYSRCVMTFSKDKWILSQTSQG